MFVLGNRMLLGFSLVRLLAAGAAAQTCYYLDGSVASSDTACNATASFSACCSAYDYCLTNNLCFSYTAQVLRRGSCTDPTWKAPQCAKYCVSGESTYRLYILHPTPLTATVAPCRHHNTLGIHLPMRRRWIL